MMVAEAEKKNMASFDDKKGNLIENNKEEQSNNTATTIKAVDDPWEFSKSQILYGSLMSNKKINKLVSMKRT